VEAMAQTPNWNSRGVTGKPDQHENALTVQETPVLELMLHFELTELNPELSALREEVPDICG
jgi:hypothetical protein